MPCIDVPRGQWPPLTVKKRLGRWFWAYLRSGAMRDMHTVVAATSDAMFWVGMTDIPDSGVCVVRRDIAVAEDLILPKGRYVDYQAAVSGVPVPALDALLRDPGRSDLAPAFRAEAVERSQCDIDTHPMAVDVPSTSLDGDGCDIDRYRKVVDVTSSSQARGRPPAQHQPSPRR